MAKLSLNGFGKILIVEEDKGKAEAFRQEFLSFHGNKVWVVFSKWLALIILTSPKNYDFVLWRDQLVCPEIARRRISEEMVKNIDWFEVDAEDGPKHEKARIQ